MCRMSADEGKAQEAGSLLPPAVHRHCTLASFASLRPAQLTHQTIVLIWACASRQPPQGGHHLHCGARVLQSANPCRRKPSVQRLTPASPLSGALSSRWAQSVGLASLGAVPCAAGRSGRAPGCPKTTSARGAWVETGAGAPTPLAARWRRAGGRVPRLPPAEAAPSHLPHCCCVLPLRCSPGRCSHGVHAAGGDAAGA
jgi:hypothetical protein